MKKNLHAIGAAVLSILVYVGGICPAAAAAVRSDAVILLDIGHAGTTLIAAGERGTVLRSDDDGRSWTSAATGVTRTLTAIAFATPKLGIAVGHAGALIRSEDGGRTWRREALADDIRDSLFGVRAVDATHFVAFGAFGLFLQSGDGGLTWTRGQVLGPDFDRHLYGMALLSPTRWLLAGESGTLVLTEDGGASWRQLPSPYEGSFFGVVKTATDAVVAFGMRGKIFRADSDLADWHEVPSGGLSAFNGGRVLADGHIALFGNNGAVAISADDGKSFRRVTLDRSADLAAAVADRSGSLVVVGENGVSHASMTASAGEPSHD